MTQTGSPVEAKHGVDDDDNLSTSTIRVCVVRLLMAASTFSDTI